MTPRYGRLAAQCSLVPLIPYAQTYSLSKAPVHPMSGGHYAVEESELSSDPSCGLLGALRRRRNELEYPLDPADRASVAQTAGRIRAAAELIDAAAKIVPNLGLM